MKNNGARRETMQGCQRSALGGMHGGRECLVSEGLSLCNCLGRADVNQTTDDLTHSLVDSFDDRVPLRVACCGGDRNNPHIV